MTLEEKGVEELQGDSTVTVATAFCHLENTIKGFKQFVSGNTQTTENKGTKKHVESITIVKSKNKPFSKH